MRAPVSRSRPLFLVRQPASLGACARDGGLFAELTSRQRLTDGVLIVHARDDHHVPVDFAIAAARRHPGWALRLLDGGGHHAHVRVPTQWSDTVVSWLRGLHQPARTPTPETE